MLTGVGACHTCICPSCGSHNVIEPSRVDTASCFPSGLSASARTSCECCSVSSAPFPLKTSHVLSSYARVGLGHYDRSSLIMVQHILQHHHGSLPKV